MCDTQVLLADNGIWFAKNSDREPHEPQALVRIPAVRGDTRRRVQTTYIEIDQVPDRHAMLLSKPTWIWGAEMGVNEHGLAIGNEAIFSRQRSCQPALLGMDLLRLGLERASTAAAGVEVIAELLERYGQGGPAGYTDKRFCYDSSFILADPHGAWVLETAGRRWAARPVERYAAISNALSLDRDYTRQAAGVKGRFRAHDTRLLPLLAGSRRRRSLSLRCLAATARQQANFIRLGAHLRQHADTNEDPLAGSNADLCMHATGPIRRSQTTGSLIAWLGPQGPRLAATGTSAPCLSLFRPLGLHGHSHALSAEPDQAELWHRWEGVHRSALFHADYRHRLRDRIDAIEAEVLAEWMQPDADLAQLDQRCAAATEDIIGWPQAGIPNRSGLAGRIWRRTA